MTVITYLQSYEAFKKEHINMDNILSIKDIYVNYAEKPVLRDVSLNIKKGHILGVVGESGSGKSTIIKTVLGILGDNGCVKDGKIIFQDRDIIELPKEELRKIRGKDIALISQDPSQAFHPVRKIGTQVNEFAKAHNENPEKVTARMLELLELFKLSNPKRVLNSYSYELSGGMAQRVSIAMAMLLNPKVLLADEVTSALDVVVQREVVKQFEKIKNEFQTSIFFVSHNMGVISYLADEIAVMYGGMVMEYGSRDNIVNNPVHEYTKKLYEAIPKMNVMVSKNVKATLPDRYTEGCPYHEGCSMACSECKTNMPELREIEPEHFVRCHEV